MKEVNLTELMAEVAAKRAKEERRRKWQRRINRVKCALGFHHWFDYKRNQCKAIAYNIIHGVNKLPATAIIQYCRRDGCKCSRGLLDMGFRVEKVPIHRLFDTGCF